MIVTFKSKAAGDVIMFGEAAHALMNVMGKDPDPTGIITPEQLPAAIGALKGVIEGSRHQPGPNEAEEAEKPAMAQHVSLAQRAVPLLELLEWSQRKNAPVTWGV
jgi:hypothetical protein